MAQNNGSKLIRTIAGIAFNSEDAMNARNWKNRNSDDKLGKGRIANAILLEWHENGREEVQLPPNVLATIEWRRLDKNGRLNGPIRYHSVLDTDMNNGRGRPKTMAYIDASPLTIDNSRINRIVTANGAIHSVSVNDEDEFEIVWESKADQKAIIVELLKTIAAQKAIIELHEGNSD